MKKLTTIIFLLLFSTSVFGAKLYVGGEKYEKDGVIALLLHLNGNMIEHTYKEKMSDCLRSKRMAEREVRPERVQFSCKKVKGLLQEDKQSKYGIRLLKILN